MVPILFFTSPLSGLWQVHPDIYPVERMDESNLQRRKDLSLMKGRISKALSLYHNHNIYLVRLFSIFSFSFPHIKLHFVCEFLLHKTIQSNRVKTFPQIRLYRKKKSLNNDSYVNICCSRQFKYLGYH